MSNVSLFMAGRAIAGILAALAFFHVSPVASCIHPPESFKGQVTEKTKSAFLFFDGSHVNIVIKTKLASSEGIPKQMAWVIPLPSLPSAYGETSEKLFDELHTVWERENPPPPPPASAARPAPPAPAAAEGIKIHRLEKVGKYELRPIEVLSESAGVELNRWLKDNGFGTVPVENQRYYLKQGNVFLAVKISDTGGSEADLKPLLIKYRSDRMILPLKFSSHSGVFDVDLYVFTRKPLTESLLRSHHLYGSKSAKYPREGLLGRWDAAREFFSSSSGLRLRDLLGERSGFISRFRGHGFNETGRLVSQMADDPSLPVTE